MSGDLTLFQEENLQPLVKASNLLAKSNLVPYSLRGKVEDVFTVLVMGNELGLPPMQAINSIHVIQGKPTLSGQIMVGMVRAKFPAAIISFNLDEKNLVAECEVKRCKEDPMGYKAMWNMDKAKALGLISKKGSGYVTQPMNMLKWRAVTEAIRVVFPDVLMGFYAKEEFQNDAGKEVIIVENLADDLDKDFPIPQEEKEFGPNYRIQNGKFRSLQLKDIDLPEIEIYLEKLKGRGEKLKQWENELITCLADYVENFDHYQDILMEAEDVSAE